MHLRAEVPLCPNWIPWRSHGQHLGGRALAKKALWARYYCRIMNEDAIKLVKKCNKCQRHADIHVTTCWVNHTHFNMAFLVLGHRPVRTLPPTAPRQIKYLIVVVVYFTKWIKVETLSKITAKDTIKFFKKSIMVRFDILEAIVTDNSRQFTNRNIQKLMVDLFIKHHFTSVEHPQTKGKVEFATPSHS